MTELEDLPFTLPALRAAYAGGNSPMDVLGEVFRRIDVVGDCGIFIDLFDFSEVQAAAEALGAFDPARPLWGIPFAVKDNIDAAGHRTTAACPAYAYAASEDAFVVKRLRDAGAILVGKTNLDQFATGLVGVRTPWQAPKNAVDPDIVPGGSSGGSGVAVGHGIVAFALGTDTAGSGRVPAALNNIVGLKPTLGALSARGVVPACRTLDTVSIFAQTVADAHAILKVASAHDPADSYSHSIPVAPLSGLPPVFSAGVPSRSSIETFGDTAQADAFWRDVDALARRGAEIREIDFTPFYDIARLLYQRTWVAERYTVVADLISKNPEALHPVTRKIIGGADEFTAADAFEDQYKLADLKRRVSPYLNAVDLLCVPSIPTFFSVADLEADPITPNSQLGTYTNFVNLLDMCGIAVPTPPRADGRPGSVTLLASAGRDAWVASVGLALESSGRMGATRFERPPAPDLEPNPVPGEMAIGVCGAHMSGLPLNGQLTERGGRFLRSVFTAPEYRLFALSGGPPKRPGLVRDPMGGSVPLELWSLPTHAVGSFLAGIPAPLGLGNLRLEDGTTVTGFLCESAGLDGAEELDPAGGWRGYLTAAE
ncbi:MAG: allophanate hydrolase [Pseudomonadota bacterium]